MAEQAQRQAPSSSIEPAQRTVLSEVTWETMNEPGAYVEIGTGDLYRVPKEALLRGASPLIIKESRGASRLVQVSPDPFCTTLEARLRAAQHNVQPNF